MGPISSCPRVDNVGRWFCCVSAIYPLSLRQRGGMEELAEESRRIKALISAEEAELEQVRREGRRLVGIGNSKKWEAENAAGRAGKAGGAPCTSGPWCRISGDRPGR